MAPRTYRTRPECSHHCPIQQRRPSRFLEEWAEGPVLDAVTARAVSAFRTLIPLTAPLVRDGGELILLKGANAANEITAAEKQIRRFRLSDVRVEPVGEGVIEEPTRVIRATVR